MSFPRVPKRFRRWLVGLGLAAVIASGFVAVGLFAKKLRQRRRRVETT